MPPTGFIYDCKKKLTELFLCVTKALIMEGIQFILITSICPCRGEFSIRLPLSHKVRITMAATCFHVLNVNVIKASHLSNI